MDFKQLRDTLLTHLRDHLEEITVSMVEKIFTEPGKTIRWRFKFPGLPAIDLRISVDHDTAPTRTGFRRVETKDPHGGPMR